MHKLSLIEDRLVYIAHTSPCPQIKDMFYSLDKDLKTSSFLMQLTD